MNLFPLISHVSECVCVCVMSGYSSLMLNMWHFSSGHREWFGVSSWMWLWNNVPSDVCHLLWWFRWFSWIRGGRNKPEDEVYCCSCSVHACVCLLVSENQFDFRDLEGEIKKMQKHLHAEILRSPRWRGRWARSSLLFWWVCFATCRLLHVAPVWQRFAFPLQQGYLFEGVAINDSILIASLYNVSEQQADSCDVRERL